MPLYYILLAWLVLALILAPVAGHYLRRNARRYPTHPHPAPPEDPPCPPMI